MTMKDSTNHYHYQNSPPILKVPPLFTLRFKTLNLFRSLLPVQLLNRTLAVIVMLLSITNRTVSNKLSNIWSICGLLLINIYSTSHQTYIKQHQINTYFKMFVEQIAKILSQKAGLYKIGRYFYKFYPF
jgi:hypothetical protein